PSAQRAGAAPGAARDFRPPPASKPARPAASEECCANGACRPVIVLNKADAMKTGDPANVVPIVAWVGLALAKATKLATVLRGDDGPTTMTMGTKATPATGAVSRMKSYLRFG